MSVSHTVAVKSLDLSVPAEAQESVDLPEHLAGLLLDVAERSRGIGGHAAEIDDRAMDRREADDRNARSSIGFADSLDVHLALLVLIGATIRDARLLQ